MRLIRHDRRTLHPIPLRRHNTIFDYPLGYSTAQARGYAQQLIGKHQLHPDDAAFVEHHYDQTYRDLVASMGITPHEGITVADARRIADFADDCGYPVPRMLSMPPLTPNTSIFRWWGLASTVVRLLDEYSDINVEARNFIIDNELEINGVDYTSLYQPHIRDIDPCAPMPGCILVNTGASAYSTIVRSRTATPFDYAGYHIQLRDVHLVHRTHRLHLRYRDELLPEYNTGAAVFPRNYPLSVSYGHTSVYTPGVSALLNGHSGGHPVPFDGVPSPDNDSD